MKNSQDWIQVAINPSHEGMLRKEVGAAPGKPIPAAKLKEAASKGGKLGQRARFAETMRKIARGKK